MPADIRSFFGGGPPKASQGSQGSQKKDEVCFYILCKKDVANLATSPKPRKQRLRRLEGQAELSTILTMRRKRKSSEPSFLSWPNCS